jgi:1-phosphatidylinositol phosphodiesterase
MQYHDNVVYFDNLTGYSLVVVKYTVNDFSVTPGQDPDGHIYDGLTVSGGSDGKLTFSVGREGSTQVADWFNDRIPPGQTTFNHTAGELNFAFLGTLELTITGGILGQRQKIYTFSNVALAQGHDVLSNNWWFGGSFCEYQNNNLVIALGADANKQDVFFLFHRGGGEAVNSIDFTPKSLIATANWMSLVGSNVTLNKIIMPGSHDAGMSETHNCNPPVGAGSYAKTQAKSIGEQLADGSRYFDIRIDCDDDALVTYHRGFGYFGCNGQDLIDILVETQAFLKANASETAILKFSHIRDFLGHDPAKTKEQINTRLTEYVDSNLLYRNTSASVNLATIPLGEVRGKMILVFDYPEFINPTNGRFRYMDGSSVQGGANVTVYDQYSDTSTFDKMYADQINKWTKYGGLGMDYLFLLSWTLTPTPAVGSSVEELAAIANPRLPAVLFDQIIAKKISNIPNIVYVDFLNDAVAQSIIMYNFA